MTQYLCLSFRSLSSLPAPDLVLLILRLLFLFQQHVCTDIPLDDSTGGAGSPSGWLACRSVEGSVKAFSVDTRRAGGQAGRQNAHVRARAPHLDWLCFEEQRKQEPWMKEDERTELPRSHARTKEKKRPATLSRTSNYRRRPARVERCTELSLFELSRRRPTTQSITDSAKRVANVNKSSEFPLASVDFALRMVSHSPATLGFFGRFFSFIFLFLRSEGVTCKLACSFFRNRTARGKRLEEKRRKRAPY